MSIVLGYDESPGSSRALQVAIELALRFEERLVLVYGVAPPGGMGEEYTAHRRSLTELARTATGQAVLAATQAGVETVVELVDAKPAQALVDVGDRYDARMIVVGTRGESAIKGAILGSTSHRLLAMSDRPVLCVPDIDTTP